MSTQGVAPSDWRGPTGLTTVIGVACDKEGHLYALETTRSLASLAQMRRAQARWCASIAMAHSPRSQRDCISINQQCASGRKRTANRS